MKPTVFSTHMVKAILADRKRHTRRLNGLEEINEKPDDWQFMAFKKKSQHGDLYALFRHTLMGYKYIKPRYQPGDTLWVREKLKAKIVSTEDGIDCVSYAAGGAFLPGDENVGAEYVTWQWKRDFLPAIFCPRYAARIFLEVEAVRIERLHQITTIECEKEGLQFQNLTSKGKTMVEQFESLWNSINGKSAWDLNSWVFVYEFLRINES